MFEANSTQHGNLNHLGSDRTAAAAEWLANNRHLLTHGFLVASSVAFVGLWLDKHGFWPSTSGDSAAKMVLSTLVISLAGFAQGLTGFGYGLVAIALLPMLMNLRDAITLAALLNLIVCASTFLSIRSHYTWRQGLGLVLGACLGVPVGTWLLVQLDESVLLRILGSMMLLFSANELIFVRARSSGLSPALAFPFGLVSGGLSGAFGVGGPPAIAFTYSQPWTKDQVAAVLQVVFGISALLRLLLLGHAGLVNTPVLFLGLSSLLPLLAAIALGHYFFSKISQSVLKKAAFLFLWLMGLKYLLFP